MKEQKIDPSKITKPMQLMAVWFLALISIVSELLTAANFIKDPKWMTPTLVIAAIASIPVFIFCIFLMQTVFRPQLQDDSYYSKWLMGEQGQQKEIPPPQAEITTLQANIKNAAVSATDSQIKRRSLMEYMILNTLWTKQVNRWPDLSLYYTFIMNFVAPSETRAFKEAGDILINEGLITTVPENGQYMLTIQGFDYCKEHHKEFPKEQWWPEEQINKNNLKKLTS